jgi:hypothetical protein
VTCHRDGRNGTSPHADCQCTNTGSIRARTVDPSAGGSQTLPGTTPFSACCDPDIAERRCSPIFTGREGCMNRSLTTTFESARGNAHPVMRATRRCLRVVVSTVALLLLGATAIHAQTAMPRNATGTGAATSSPVTSTNQNSSSATTAAIPGSNTTSSPASASATSAITTSSVNAATTISGSAADGSTSPTTTGSAAGTTSLSGSSGSISASSATNPDAALQLPGEAPNASTNTANTTASSGAASSAGGSAGSICGPAVPATDGGSVNLTEVVPGFSPSGC